MPNDSTYLKSLLDCLHGDLQKVVTNFSDYVLSKGGLLPSKIFTINVEIDEINEKLKPLLKKITDKESLDLADKNLKLEEGKLRSIEEIDLKESGYQEAGR